MPLIPLLRAEAERRAVLAPGEAIDAARAFALVRDLTYQRASASDPETTIREWRGTCSGKHHLLQALFEELGYRTILIAATHRFTLENTPWAPPELRALLAAGPVPDVHDFLRLQHDPQVEPPRWMTVDATWPLGAHVLGLPANERFEPGRDMAVAADVDELFHVPRDVDQQQFKQRIIEREFGAAEVERRERFLAALSRWLVERVPGPAAPATG
ncbi:MAG: hypothetical protein EXR65_01205 [Dehalococcoidia bacterium]|nr:hypothetical protein [Dehalococcoidia bacterium]